MICTLPLLLILFVLFTLPAAATEGGGGAYPNGAEDFMSGALPHPGTYFINYLNYYSAEKFQDISSTDFKISTPALISCGLST